MLNWKFWRSFGNSSAATQRKSCDQLIETLEDRTLLSATGTHALHTALKHSTKVHAATVKPAKVTHTKAAKSSKHHNAGVTSNVIASNASASNTSTTSTGSTTVPIFGDHGHVLSTIPFSQAPTAVQNGLTTLAATDHLTAPAATDTVHLGNHNGVETYSLLITSTGTQTDITVDQNGNPVTQPTLTTTTFGTLSGTGTGSDAAAAAEITAIASAVGLTAPASTDTVNISTTAGGAVTYSIHLTRSTTSTTTTTDDHDFFENHGETISVDANGNPVGAQELPFSVMPTKIQNGINAHLPTGATALATTSTQSVRVLTIDGTTYYSTTFDTSGTQTTVTVDAAGNLATLPTSSTADFSTIPAAAQTELQTLATANGVTGAIAGTQTVNVFNEGNGTTIYSVSLSATNSSTSQTYMITISVDQAGNPTVPPQNFGSGPEDCGGGFAGDGFAGNFGDGDGDGFGGRG